MSNVSFSGRVEFSYRPRSGSKVVRLCLRRDMLYGEAIVGDWLAGDIVQLGWSAAIPRKYWRQDAIRAGIEIVERVGGWVLDTRGYVEIAVPREYAIMAEEIMRIVSPFTEIVEREEDYGYALRKHNLYRAGVLEITMSDSGRLEFQPQYTTRRFSDDGYAYYGREDGKWRGAGRWEHEEYIVGKLTLAPGFDGLPQVGVKTEDGEKWLEVWGHLKCRGKPVAIYAHPDTCFNLQCETQPASVNDLLRS